MEFIDNISKTKCEQEVSKIRSFCGDSEIKNIIEMLAKPLGNKSEYQTVEEYKQELIKDFIKSPKGLLSATILTKTFLLKSKSISN